MISKNLMMALETDQRGQPRIYVQVLKLQRRGHLTNENLLPTTETDPSLSVLSH